MGKPRSDGQITFTISLDEELAKKVDAARGSKSRSEFLRTAAAEKLQAMGIFIPQGAVAAPDRAGKGGRKPKASTLLTILAEEGEPYLSPTKKQASKKKT